MINLLVVEDSPVFAEALLLMLQAHEGWNVVKIVNTAEKALQAIPDLSIDLVLVDISLPKMNGIELVQVLQQHCPEIPCLILSGDTSRKSVHRALAVGARGYLLKDRASNIREAIHRVLAGELYIGPGLQDILP